MTNSSSISGYSHRFGKNVGGINEILLIPVCNIRGADFDPADGNCTRISLHDPSNLALCSFGEGAAKYREEADYRSGIPNVTQTLEFETDKIGRESNRLIRELAGLSVCGVAAVVTTRNNVRLLIGFSNEHREERPLRLFQVEGSSGRVHTDPGREVIRLISRGTARASVFSGDIG